VRSLLISLFVILMPGSVFADQNSCSTGLTGVAKVIFNFTKEHLSGSFDLVPEVAQNTRQLIGDGKVAKDRARAGAAGALTCLMQPDVAALCADVGDECTYDSDCCSRRCIDWGGELGKGCGFSAAN
jgi:hypothetical protein